MTLNDVLTKQNVITKLVLTSDKKELPKELKVKIMRVRMAYNKIKKQFDQDVEEFSKDIVSDELRDLASNNARTEEQDARYNELNAKVNSEYTEFMSQKGKEEISDDLNDKFTEDEYADIVDVNANNDVTINGNTIKAADFLEAVYELFVA